MQLETLKFPTIELLAEFECCCGAFIFSYNLEDKTLTGRFLEADIELATNVFNAELVNSSQ